LSSGVPRRSHSWETPDSPWKLRSVRLRSSCSGPHLVLRLGVDGLQLPAQPQPEQDPARVRRGLDPGAHLAQLRRLLQHGGPQPALAQREGGGETTEAATDDGDRVGLAGRSSLP
jgi:hypothetical protein